jgi:predicted alpha/beta superfamily hydrolase
LAHHEPHINRGTLHVHRRFHSRALRNSRDLAVWLPPGYGKVRHRRHPVVYFQDGQNIFDPATAFLGNAWHAGEAAARLIHQRRIVPPIMVGIANTGHRRVHEYSPTRAEVKSWDDESTIKVEGLGRSYARFVVNEVMPFVEARYLAHTGPRHTSLVGSSMGALISLYKVLWHPRSFGAIAALSPSLWWDNRVVFRDFARLARKPDVRLWLDMGTAEPGWESAALFRDTLVGRGWAQGGDLHFQEVKGGEHSEKAWAARVDRVLEFLVGRE